MMLTEEWGDIQNWFGTVYAIPDTKVDLWSLLDDTKWEVQGTDLLTETQELIIEECEVLKALLLEKNRKYGDSAINPTRLFSKASPVEQINVRLDDKISRIKSSQSDEDEDVELDIMGYLILKRVAKRLEENI